jgi:hypothetical protein
MKQFICILGACLFSLVDLGLLFKIMHWPGAAFMLLIGMGAMPFLIILTAVYIADKKPKQQ